MYSLGPINIKDSPAHKNSQGHWKYFSFYLNFYFPGRSCVNVFHISCPRVTTLTDHAVSSGKDGVRY